MQQEERGVLGQGVGHFHVTAARPPSCQNGKMVPVPSGCGSKWIGVKGGGVILNIQILQPFQVVKHEPGSKTRRPPLLQILVDPGGLRRKLLAAAIELAIVIQIMHPHFKTLADQIVPQFLRHPVICLPG